ncbi:hypothetical protein [Paracoccus sp. (in: a-proteobacteria)]|uniref:hypothetical protein n=1 Tax=Paracoccus sp. TaxID=267 RepID=UPI003A8903B2
MILPETRKLKAVEITDVPDGARLMALGLIGYLPLTSAITLNIVPKFPIQNLWTMLEVGGESYARILPTLRRYQTTSNPAPIQLLARSFCHYLRNALSAGFERSYYRRAVNGYYRPRVEFGQTIGRYGDHLPDDDLSEKQKKEFLLALWNIMRAFAEVGFSLKAGDKFHATSDIGMDDVLSYIYLEDTEPETVASSKNSNKKEPR